MRPGRRLPGRPLRGRYRATVFIRLVALEIVVADGGTVSFADGSGTTLVCPKNCSATYPAGETVKLSAAPSDGYADPDWQRNGCPQGPDCTVELDADTTVTPVFARVRRLLELTLTGKGTGAVSSDDPPFECRDRRCTEQVVEGSTVQLVAVPADDSELESWGGDAKNCASSLDCSIVIDESPAVTAHLHAEASSDSHGQRARRERCSQQSCWASTASARTWPGGQGPRPARHYSLAARR